MHRMRLGEGGDHDVVREEFGSRNGEQNERDGLCARPRVEILRGAHGPDVDSRDLRGQVDLPRRPLSSSRFVDKPST